MNKVKIRKHTIKRIDEDGKTFTYFNLSKAAEDIDSPMENWKIELLIAQAINTKTKAFKSKWLNIKN